MHVLLKIIMIICLIGLSSAESYASYGQTLCRQSPDFICVTVKRGQSWESLWPNYNERNIVKRVNRLNIDLWAGMTLAVPKDLSEDSNLLDYSPFPLHIQPSGEKFIIVDPKVYAFGAYDASGSLVRWGPVSGGSDWCDDISEPCHTRPGIFRIFSLGGSTCISHKFPLPEGGAPMPYCMYFNRGQALHGEPHGLPGYHASHGCVRMYVDDAEWLRYDFVEPPNPNNQYRGTKVIIESYHVNGDDDLGADQLSNDDDEYLGY